MFSNDLYTDAQVIALQAAITVSASLSAIGSSLIMFHATHKRHSSTRHRILLGLSAFDAMASIANILFPFAFHSRHRMPGPDCTAEGFFQLLGIGAILYNLSLSIYFLLCITFAVRQEQLARFWEPWLHAVSILYPLAWAVAGLAWDVYNPNVYHYGCHVNAYPRACDRNDDASDLKCERGGNGKAAWFLLGSTVVPILTTWAALFVNTTIIC